MDTLLRVDTERSGPFTFRLGLDAGALEALYLRVTDAQHRFRLSPLASVASRLEREVVVSSVFGTNSIEGGTLTEAQTQLALDLDPADVRNTEQRRAINIKAAYDLAREAAATPAWNPDVAFVRQIHAAITRDLPHEHDRPGVLRANPRGIATHVGDVAHGGRYRPPQHGRDVERLLVALMDWHAGRTERGVPALARAPLLHYYFELVHPFWDGNGRVGRVLEAAVLYADGFRHAPFAQARYYLEHIAKYFALFNQCRKRADAKEAAPNTPFVRFFLEGMLQGINGLHDRVNVLLTEVLYENDLKRAHDDNQLNARQYAIARAVLDGERPLPLAKLRRAPWYQALYQKLTDKTKQRDLRRLREQGWLVEDAEGRLQPPFMRPEPE